MTLDKIESLQPRFDLSDFQVGPIVSIAGDRWGTYVSIPVDGQLMLSSGDVLYQHSDSGNPTEWHSAELSWTPAHIHTPDATQQMESMKVADVIKMASFQWSSVPVTYTRYAAFTVNATFKGQTTGPHKAIFFFGTDQNGKEYVAVNDLLSGTQALWGAVSGKSYYPVGLLSSKLRELPTVHSWITAQEASCSNAKHTLCCTNGRCGISVSDVNADLGTPLPPAKDGGAQ